MQHRPFGSTGTTVPMIGLGTWNMERDDPAAAGHAIRRGLDEGMTHVDTAEMYGSGEVEALLGEALSGRRDEVFLASKVLPSNATFDGILSACERSLERLRTDHLDLYLLHWPSEHPLEETVAAFEKLVEQGKTRFWGVSNFDVEELEELLDVAGQGRVACNQVLYHLDERYIELGLLDRCKQHGMAVVGYSPFGSGRFPSPASRRGRVLEAIARAHGATARQVALSFLLRDDKVFIIPKASRVEHVADNAAAADLQLGQDEIQQLEDAFPLEQDRSELPFI